VRLALVFSLLAPPGDGWFGADKFKHFLSAAFVQSMGYGTLRAAGARHDLALAGASGATAAVSVAKEVHDRRTKGLFSGRDLVWDAAGAGAATLLVQHRGR
jgi:putative lipoprotein